MALLDFLNIGAKIIDKVIPDPAAKAAAQLKLLELQQAGELKVLDADLQIALAQADINKTEASDPSLFKSGWRPAVGWVCVVGLFYTFLGQPLIAWASTAYGVPAPPSLDMGDLFTLLAGMLGLGGFRTFEKMKKVA
ncbi:MAG TPA: 3TM-type holin [Vicinamibacterales bacterium]|nr:3TM-type holin [Vicinamibacterales bacterium]